MEWILAIIDEMNQVTQRLGFRGSKNKKMTIALRNTNTKLAKLSKKANAGDVEHIMKLQDVGPKMLVVIRVIKKVTYPHAVKVSKISEKPEPRKAKAQ